MFITWLACTREPSGESSSPAEARSACDDVGLVGVDVDGQCVPCDPPTGTQMEQHVRFEGEKRYYMLHVPETYRCEQPIPVLFDLHGTASGGYPEEAYGLSEAVETAESEGFLLVRPRSRSSMEGGYEIYRWDQNPGDPELNAAFLEHLLDEVGSRYVIDPDRVYLMGFSSGTNQVSIANGDPETSFRGFGHVGGGLWSAPPPRALGRFYLHTPYRDYMRVYHHTLVAELREAGVAEADIFERKSFSGHELYGWLYPELWAWLDRGERPPPGAGIDPRWSPIEGAPTELLALTVDASGLAWFTGADGTIWSFDGDTFVSSDISGAPFAEETALTSICLMPDGRGAAVGNGTVLWTEDGGESFVHLDPLPEPGPPMFGYAHWTGVGCGEDEIMGVGYWSAGRTSDGVTFGDVALGSIYRAQAQAAAQGPSGTWMAAGYYGYLARSETGSAFATTDARDMHWVLDVAPVAQDVWVAVGDGGWILRSEDDGRSFESVLLMDYDLYAVSFADSTRGLAVGRAGRALYTDDGGQNWQDVSLGLDVMLSDVAFLPSGEAIVAGEGGPYLWAP